MEIAGVPLPPFFEDPIHDPDGELRIAQVEITDLSLDKLVNRILHRVKGYRTWAAWNMG
jgi:hypothetical protein